MPVPMTHVGAPHGHRCPPQLSARRTSPSSRAAGSVEPEMPSPMYWPGLMTTGGTDGVVIEKCTPTSRWMPLRLRFATAEGAVVAGADPHYRRRPAIPLSAWGVKSVGSEMATENSLLSSTLPRRTRRRGVAGRRRLDERHPVTLMVPVNGATQRRRSGKCPSRCATGGGDAMPGRLTNLRFETTLLRSPSNVATALFRAWFGVVPKGRGFVDFR